MHCVMRKLIPWMLCVLMAAGVLFSAWFLVQEIHHDCTGATCSTCVCLRMAARQLRWGGRPAAAAAVAAAAYAVVRILGEAVCMVSGVTPVHCKVRLDN